MELHQAELDRLVNEQVGRIVSNMSESDKAKMVRIHTDKYDPCPCGSGKQFKWCCWSKK